MRRRLALLLLLVGCSERKATPPAPAPPDAAPFREEAVVHPVYPPGPVAAQPAAVRLCDAIHALPARRKAECCNAAGSSQSVADQCVHALSIALLDGSVTIDAPALDGCVAAATTALTGCDWVRPLAPAPPATCRGLLQGHVAAGARCRSSLECAAGLSCRGVGPTDTGTCAPPAPPGTVCGISVDALVALAGESDTAHPPCAGFCRSGRCNPPTPLAGKCVTSLECGPDAHCAAGVCAARPLPAAGEACTDLCRDPAACIKGTCQQPKAKGEACTSPFECQASCVSGTCGPKCPP